MRTMICGYSGSGKSTLAGWLGRVQNCPVLYLDTVQFSSGWEERNRTEAEKMVQEFWKQKKTGSWTAIILVSSVGSSG